MIHKQPDMIFFNHLSRRVINALERNGVETYEELIEAIQNNGLMQYDRRNQDVYHCDGFGSMNMGPVAWKEIIAMLDAQGFQWQEYVFRRWEKWQGHGKPRTKARKALRVNLEVKELNRNIKRLTELLEEFLAQEGD